MKQGTVRRDVGTEVGFFYGAQSPFSSWTRSSAEYRLHTVGLFADNAQAMAALKALGMTDQEDYERYLVGGPPKRKTV